MEGFQDILFVWWDEHVWFVALVGQAKFGTHSSLV